MTTFARSELVRTVEHRLGGLGFYGLRAPARPPCAPCPHGAAEWPAPPDLASASVSGARDVFYVVTSEDLDDEGRLRAVTRTAAAARSAGVRFWLVVPGPDAVEVKAWAGTVGLRAAVLRA